MKKRRISINYQDGENKHLNGMEVPENSDTGQKMGQYAVLELEVDHCLKDVDTELFRDALKNARSKFVEEEKEVYVTKAGSIFSRSYFLAIAASFALIVGVVCILMYISSFSTGYQKIFTQYYQPYQNEYITRSDQVTINNLYVAFQAYENHEYSKAIVLYNKVIKSDHTLLMAYFYKGISCIEIKNYKDALESLSRILKNENNPYYSQAKWYTALTMLNINKPEDAKQHLKWLALNDRYYGVKAKEILKLLDK